MDPQTHVISGTNICRNVFWLLKRANRNSVLIIKRVLFSDSSLTVTDRKYSVLRVCLFVVSVKVLGALEAFTLVKFKDCLLANITNAAYPNHKKNAAFFVSLSLSCIICCVFTTCVTMLSNYGIHKEPNPPPHSKVY